MNEEHTGVLEQYFFYSEGDVEANPEYIHNQLSINHLKINSELIEK